MRADGKLLIGRGAALELDAVDGARVVEIDDIAVLYRFTLDFYLSRSLLASAVDFRIHIVRRNIILNFVDFNTLIFAQSNLGLDGDDCMELDTLIVHAVDIHLRVVDGENFLVLVKSLHICFAEGVVESVVKKYALTVKLLNHLARRMSLAEARNIELGFVFKISLVKACVPFLGSERKRDFDFALAFFNRVIHNVLQIDTYKIDT